MLFGSVAQSKLGTETASLAPLYRVTHCVENYLLIAAGIAIGLYRVIVICDIFVFCDFEFSPSNFMVSSPCSMVEVASGLDMAGVESLRL